MLIEERIPRRRKLGRALTLKCPKCGFGKVFYPAKFPGVRPQMRTTCEHCGYSFEREEGYYRGAVYLSYGLMLVEGVLAFLLSKFLIFGLSTRDSILIAITAMLFLSFYNYRIARVIWLSKDDEPAKIA
jgi:uncharacterized protein (DUF983 family)